MFIDNIIQLLNITHYIRYGLFSEYFFHATSCYSSLAFSSHTILLFVPQTVKACSCLKAFLSVAPTFWNALPHKASYSSFRSQFINRILKAFLIIIPFYCFLLILSVTLSEIISCISSLIYSCLCHRDVCIGRTGFLSGSLLLLWSQE